MPTNFILAVQVAADLGTMLDTMRAQQAAVEDRVTSMQSAVLQLVPEQVSKHLKTAIKQNQVWLL